MITIEDQSKQMKKEYICLISWTRKGKRNGNRKYMRWLLKTNQKKSNNPLISNYSVARKGNGGNR